MKTDGLDSTVLELKNITKSFDGTQVLKGIDLQVEKGEFVTLLGSSGCGKTTTLRIIAGLEAPDGGQVILNGTDMTFEEPNKRNVNTVFQNYALFPHMSVYDNVAYSLKIRKVDKQEIAKRVIELLELVQLEGYEKRMPSQLSGGQKQRVAIARALVNRPEVLLLDEPLGALDLQLRRQMQLELKKLQKRLGITFIYITHDQEEALNMSDRIVVMREGVFMQIGSPAEVYDQPQTEYVARFVGNANILTGLVKHTGTGGRVQIGEQSFPADIPDHVPAAEQVSFAIRSENLLLNKAEDGGYIDGVIKEKSFAGGQLRIVIGCAGHEDLIASRHGIDIDLHPGDTVRIGWDPSHAVLLAKEN